VVNAPNFGPDGNLGKPQISRFKSGDVTGDVSEKSPTMSAPNRPSFGKGAQFLSTLSASWIRKPVDRVACSAVSLPDPMKVLPGHKHEPVKAGIFFLKVRRSQQEANQAGKILDRIEVTSHARNRDLHLSDQLLCGVHRGDLKISA
jgi:hypothetical protein